MKTLTSDSGFSLLEVLVATLILALTFSAVFPIFGSAPQRIEDTRSLAFATSLAATHLEQQILRQAWDEMPVRGEQEGWAWEVSGEPYDEAPPADDSDYPFKITVKAWKLEDPDRVLASLQRVVWVTE